jgi:hypothetical protein
VKPGDAVVERIAAKQVEQETKATELAVAVQARTAETAKTAVNYGLAKKTKQPVSCSPVASLALARSAGIHALPVDLAGLRARVG